MGAAVDGLQLTVMRSWLNSRIGPVIAAIFVAIWTFPHLGYGVGTDPDNSWGVALHMARHTGMAFGRNIVFNIGPLGFLVQTSMAYPFQGTVAALLRVPVMVTTAWFLVRRLQPSFSFPLTVLLAIPLTWAIGAVLAPGGEVLGIPLILVAAWGVGETLRTEGRASSLKLARWG